MADNDQDPVTQTQLQTALAKLQTDTLDQAKRAAILEAERIADERTTPATWTDFAWRLMWLVPRFFASGFFFMLAGALLLYIASTDIPKGF